jgi:hypothetical protein
MRELSCDGHHLRDRDRNEQRTDQLMTSSEVPDL